MFFTPFMHFSPPMFHFRCMVVIKGMFHWKSLKYMMHLPGMTAVEVIYTSSGQFPNKDGYCESTFVCPLEETKE